MSSGIRKIALVGTPNCGKSSLFNLLTGLNQKVGNFPGVTVDRKSGTLRHAGEEFKVIDLPGTYSLHPRAEDERITTQVLLNTRDADHPDLVLMVADHANPRRCLVLASQVHDLGIPMILVLNMSDLIPQVEAEKRAALLETKMGVPVLSVSALKNEGIRALKNKIAAFKPLPASRPFFRIPDPFSAHIQKRREEKNLTSDFAAWLNLLDDPASGIQEADGLRASELAVRNDLAGEWLDSENSTQGFQDFSSRLDRILLHPVFGYLIFLSILFLVFQAIFSWAELPMDLIDTGFSKTGEALRQILPEHFLTGLLVDGLWAGLGGILVFIPQIAFLFMFISILEESGYMSRVVFLMDRFMRPFGFSGKSIIPLIGGMACAVPSIMMARSIPSRKERLITILVTPLMSCSARIPVYTLMIGLVIPAVRLGGILQVQGLVLMGMYLLSFFTALIAAFVMKRFIAESGSTVFVTELPLYRRPPLKNVLLAIFNKCRTFVTETGKIILLISSLLWLMASTGPGNEMKHIRTEYAAKAENVKQNEVLADSILREGNSAVLKASWAGKLGSFIEPVIRPLGFDWKIGISLITSFAAREVFVSTMATLYSTDEGDESYSALKNRMRAERWPDTGEPIYSLACALALLVFYAFAMQCMSTLAVVKRETASWKWPLIMLAYMSALAWLGAFLTYELTALLS